MSLPTYIGTWSSTSVPYVIAHGEIEVKLITDSLVEVYIRYSGLYQNGKTLRSKLTINWEAPVNGEYLIISSNLNIKFKKLDGDHRFEGHYDLHGHVIDQGVFELTLTEEIACVNCDQYYSTYHGHPVDHLQTIHNSLKMQGYQQFIWLAGDSSLDNKHWLLDQPRQPAVNGYQSVLSPPISVPDVCYWLNQILSETPSSSSLTGRIAAMMTSIEATTLAERSRRLPSQDQFICDHIQPDDFLIVSVGGNDIALNPSGETICNLASLILLSSSTIRDNPSFWYFVQLFKDCVIEYINLLISNHKPKKILVCMIYFPCEDLSQSSWAQITLSLSGYNLNPKKLQNIIELIYEEATQQIQIEGVEVVPIPLFNILDSKNKLDYVERVEPSVEGGRKMAQTFLEQILP